MSHTPPLHALAVVDHIDGLVQQRLRTLTQSVKSSHRERSAPAVHDLRVAARRLRAFGVTFGRLLGDKQSADLEQELKRVTRAGGALRDLDVQLGLLEGRATGSSNELERASLEHLLEQMGQRRASVATKAERRLRKLDKRALSRSVRRAARTVSAELLTLDVQRDCAQALLERLIADATQQAPPGDGSEHPEGLHRLRIDCKQIRYALEFFEPLLGVHFARLYERATQLQDLLGRHHDLITLDEVLEAEGAELEHKGRLALSSGVQRAREAFKAERRSVLERFLRHGFDPQWWRETLHEAFVPGRLNGAASAELE